MTTRLARFRSHQPWRLAAAGALGLLWLAAGLAGPDSLAALAIQTTAKTALVLGLAYLALKALRRWQWTGARARQVSVLESLRLTPRQTLHLIRVGGRVLLIGASDAHLCLLAEIEPPAAPDDAAPDADGLAGYPASSDAPQPALAEPAE